MASLNQVVLIGNLTRDPELRQFDGGRDGRGNCVANCGIAVNERWRDQQGNEQEKVTFVDFEAWGRTAEVLNEYCRKGKLVCIVGKLKLDEWEDRETGQKRQKLKVQCLNLQMLGSREGDGQGGGGGQGGGQRRDDRGGSSQGRDDDRGARRNDGRDQGGGGDVNFDDIPF